MLRLITDGRISPEEAVRAYHGVLQGKGLKPHRPLEDDSKLTDQTMSYDGSSARRATVEVANNPLAARTDATRSGVLKTGTDGSKQDTVAPDFASMTPAQRLAYDQQRL